ncbi:MAG: eukaryotic-like serine/threonine-protein kinase, partial [Actinomycetota bacterium]|nr:eukaryotic-like serine/threonine-protein kinase [Actinomycetota bacterium]
DTVPTPSSKNPRVPAELDELVLWATAREPDERPRDARVMLEQLQETQSLLGTSAATSATTVQRTAVYQPSLPIRGATAETAVLRGRARTSEAVAAPTTSTSVLAAKAQKRRARGWWLFGLVILLAALAGGTGWYFGAGPGAQATVPDVAGRSVEAATTLLTDQGFRVASTVADVHDPVVDRGLVSRTTPQAGASVSKGAVITLKKSIGPALIALPTLIGIPEQQAKDAITKARFVNAAKSIQQFDNKVALGTVIDALDNNGKSLAGRSTYSEQRQITLVVSAGPLPKVTGLSYADAAARVTAAGLTPQPGSQIYNAKVDKNLVIEIERDKNSSGVTQPIRVGESVSLTISRGPEMVVIPNVIGDTWLVAKQKLIDAGFTNLNYNKKADAAPSVVTVDTVTPNVGQKVAKGSTLTITFTI